MCKKINHSWSGHMCACCVYHHRFIMLSTSQLETGKFSTHYLFSRSLHHINAFHHIIAACSLVFTRFSKRKEMRISDFGFHPSTDGRRHVIIHLCQIGRTTHDSVEEHGKHSVMNWMLATRNVYGFRKLF
jgi:hypothetical protein